ncbi:NHLP bacteriocin export ABC transporter permease/ATPase subunit [Oculatella sp. LEGE 06141]|uniref:NHLP bacteriocin export ABC transporter permease/ATPase subunit n=1 Tax=Oculatella sp. LEGE 06141 TaxID=1828648 RepID=UPI0018804614|nr:NHLP bacteriocin export ABC transporter permease/ATPase subunit [Oculatella sp. LEGE 06141]MBE9180196.1 NHLP bacteriocin export ABC transporter permease/ATPase subunit [Oculatella sp. LEGE 06141]
MTLHINLGLRQINGNEPLLLNEPQLIWRVQSGSLALFAVPVQNGTVEGDRRYLFNIKPGEALFGMELAGEQHFALIAVPLEPTELLPVPISEATQHPGFRSLLENWVHSLGQIKGLPQPKSVGIVPETQYVSLMQGQIYQPLPGQVLWIRVQQGKLRWLGYPDLVLDQEMGCFPVGNGAWVEADDHLELFARSTIDVQAGTVEAGTILLNGLAQLHVYFLRCIEFIAEQEAQESLLRFQARQELNQQVTQHTVRNLAAILKPQQERGVEAEMPLLAAAGAVGKALGVTIQPPASSEDLKRVKEPLEAIARSSRLRLRRVLLRNNWWKMDSGPLLAYTARDKYPVALLPVGDARYELFDPMRVADASEGGQPGSARIPVDEAIAQTIDPVAFVFYRPLPDGVLNAISLLKFALQGRQRDIIAILLTGVAATLLGMLVPQATAVLIDSAIPYGNSGLLVQIGLGLLAAAFGGASFQLAQAIASMRIETLSDASLQAAVWDRLLQLKTSFFRQYSTGDLNSRVSGIGAIRRKLSGTALQTIFAGFFSLLNLGLLFYYSSKLANLALGLALVVVTFTTISGSLIIRKNRPLMELEGDIFGLVVQLINGVPKLRIAGVEERAFAHWGQKYTQQLQLLVSTQRLEDTVVLFNTVMPTLTTVMLFWLASTLIDPTQAVGNGGGLSTGSFLAFSVAFGIFIGGVTSLSNTLIEVLDVIPLWQRSQPILAAQPEVDLNKASPGRLSGRVQLDHLSFRYREDGPLNLDEVCIEAYPGEFIALVGPSGSGKSTALRLLLGFETPISGTVYYDGQDLMGLDVAAVRRQLGVVLQNSRINAGSIFENIASGALVSLDEAWTAAEMSGFADDVRAMPMQMHTLVSEGGTNISGGQRQRLVIARALALEPRILLFDEATSALDNRTQAIVSQSLDQLNVTRIVIAHRLSTIRHADRIYVLQAGRVVQQGRYEELANQPGLFAQLVRRQTA